MGKMTKKPIQKIDLTLTVFKKESITMAKKINEIIDYLEPKEVSFSQSPCPGHQCKNCGKVIADEQNTFVGAWHPEEQDLSCPNGYPGENMKCCRCVRPVEVKKVEQELPQGQPQERLAIFKHRHILGNWCSACQDYWREPKTEGRECRACKIMKNMWDKDTLCYKHAEELADSMGLYNSHDKGVSSSDDTIKPTLQITHVNPDCKCNEGGSPHGEISSPKQDTWEVYSKEGKYNFTPSQKRFITNLLQNQRQEDVKYLKSQMKFRNLKGSVIEQGYDLAINDLDELDK